MPSINDLKPIKNEAFCEEIKKSIRAGGGLTPFIGSGLSAQSGILMGQEFNEYLTHVVWRCVEGSGAGTDYWDLGKNGWPHGPNEEQVDSARKWVGTQFEKICERSGWEVQLSDDFKIRGIARKNGLRDGDWLSTAVSTPFIPPVLSGSSNPLQKYTQDDPFDAAASTRECVDESRLRQIHRVVKGKGLEHGGWLPPDYSPTSRELIIERAIRSLYDWRSTLLFLSELRLTDGTEKQMRLSESDPDVIDTFNYHITQGRRPNLGHILLCHLCRIVRSRIILTTNFDKLVEQSFAELGDHIEEIPVSIKGRLPSPEIVHSRNTIVKLHGSLSETRADFSLDEPPSIEDKNRFFNYVRGGDPGNPKDNFLPTDLFVVGFSGRDVRCIQMMKYVLDCDAKARIFWVCHSERDAENVRSFFPEESYHENNQIVVTVCQRADLLFYELYEKITLSQPAGGLGHHLSDTLPPDTDIDLEEILDPEERKFAEIFNQKTGERAKEIAAQVKEKHHGMVIVRGGTGTLAAMSKFARNNYDGRNIWLEMEDFFDTGSLAYGLFQALAIHRGSFRISHTCLVPPDLAKPFKEGEGDAEFRARIDQWKKQIAIVTKRIGIKPGDWLISLYGRNGPGGCIGWFEKDNYWSEKEYGAAADKGKGTEPIPSALMAFIGALAGSGFTCVYAPCRGSSIPSIVEHSDKALTDSMRVICPLSDWDLPTTGEIVQDTKDLDFARDNAIKRLDGLGQDHNLKRCMYVASLFRQSRHHTALLRTKFLDRPHPFNLDAYDNDEEAAVSLQTILDDWQQKHYPRIFHPKPGGFHWLYRDIRQRMRELGETDKALTNQRTIFEFSIGEWYLRTFRVTGHATPLMEAAFHFFQAAQHSHELKYPQEIDSRLKDNSQTEEHHYLVANIDVIQAYWWRKSVGRLLKTLRIGKGQMLYWMGPPAQRNWFSAKAVNRVCKIVRDTMPKYLNPMSDSSDDSILCNLFEREIKQLSERVTENSGHKRRIQFKTEGQIWEAGFSGQEKIGLLEDFLSCVNANRRMSRMGSASTVPKEPNNILDPKNIDEDFERYLNRRVGKESVTPLRLLQYFVETAHEISRAAKLQTQTVLGGPEELDVSFLGAEEDENPDRPPIMKLWRKACIHASLALEIETWLLPGAEVFAQRERAKAYTIYGLSHARMYRFTSAHRMLDNAQRLLHPPKSEDANAQIGIVELRRAEAHLIEAKIAREIAELKNLTKVPIGLKTWLKGIVTLHPKSDDTTKQKKKYLRLIFVADENGETAEYFIKKDQANRLICHCCANIDDAWICLENAHRLLAVNTHSASWWGRLLAMQLRCFMLIPPKNEFNSPPPRLLPNRKAHDLFEMLQSIYERGIETSPNDAHNRMRTLDYFLRALINTDKHKNLNEKRKQALKSELKRQLDILKVKVEEKGIMECQNDSSSGFPEAIKEQNYRKTDRLKYLKKVESRAKKVIRKMGLSD